MFSLLTGLLFLILNEWQIINLKNPPDNNPPSQQIAKDGIFLFYYNETVHFSNKLWPKFLYYKANIKQSVIKINYNIGVSKQVYPTGKVKTHFEDNAAGLGKDCTSFWVLGVQPSLIGALWQNTNLLPELIISSVKLTPLLEKILDPSPPSIS